MRKKAWTSRSVIQFSKFVTNPANICIAFMHIQLVCVSVCHTLYIHKLTFWLSLCSSCSSGGQIDCDGLNRQFQNVRGHSWIWLTLRIRRCRGHRFICQGEALLRLVLLLLLLLLPSTIIIIRYYSPTSTPLNFLRQLRFLFFGKSQIRFRFPDFVVRFRNDWNSTETETYKTCTCVGHISTSLITEPWRNTLKHIQLTIN